MEKNYKVRIDRAYKKEAELTEYFEGVGQAMVRVKTFGKEMLAKEKCSLYYAWTIYIWTPDEQKGDLELAMGEYDRAWNPVITEVKTIE